MIRKKTARLRRAVKTRAIIRRCGMHRLYVHRTSRHIYAHITLADGSRTLAAASTLDKEIVAAALQENKSQLATRVGKMIACRALEKDLKDVAFDRSGFKYHGRVKALAEAARSGGLNF